MDKKTNEAINKPLANQIESAQIRLYDKLVHLDIKSLNISEYNQRYLGGKISKIKQKLSLYGKLLYFSLINSPVSYESFVLVDYGGGSGLISLLAIEMGIGTVIYNDIYDVSCEDVNRLSNSIGLTLDHIVCGDVDDLISYLHKNTILINAITSYDVLEHIYDVEYHFRSLGSLSNQFRVVYGSGANIANPLYVYLVSKSHRRAEYNNREKRWGHKERDTLQSYFEIRKNMISSYAPDLSSKKVEWLARSTRGLIQHDIEKCVDEYSSKGKVTYRPDHPTNTCDPYTGNWCEHLMNFRWLAKVLKNEGFSAEIISGQYNISGSLPVKILKLFFNVLNKVFGRRSMFAAAYYVVNADFIAEQNTAQDGSSATLHSIPVN